MTKYRLNIAEGGTVTLNFVPRTKEVNGKKITTYNNYMRLSPGIIYEEDDEILLDFLKDHMSKVAYTAAAEKILRDNNIPYEIERCRSCGGKIKKLKYHTVEVIDE